MSSHLMFQWEEEAEGFLWDPSLVSTLGWTSTGTSNSSFLSAAEEEAAEQMPMWANGPSTLSQWSAFHEDTVLFGDYDHHSPPLGGGHEQEERAEQEEEEVISESCLNSRRLEDETGAERHATEDDDVEAILADVLEEQVHFFEASHETAGDDASKEAVKQEIMETLAAAAIKEERDAEEEALTMVPRLMVNLETGGGGVANNCSVVSTPDVVNDVIMLEDEGLFRRQDNLIKIEESSQAEDIEFVFDEDEGEYVEAYVDESDLGFSTNPSSVATTGTSFVGKSNANTEAEEEEEDDGDEEYKPPVKKRPVRQASRRSGGVEGSSGYVKKRGRPAKPLRTHLTPRELAHLEPEEKRDFEMRFKNNEASRLSRFKRRQKDEALNEVCHGFERENQGLRRILKEHKRLHNELWTLIVGLKMPE